MKIDNLKTLRDASAKAMLVSEQSAKEFASLMKDYAVTVPIDHLPQVEFTPALVVISKDKQFPSPFNQIKL